VLEVLKYQIQRQTLILTGAVGHGLAGGVAFIFESRSEVNG
jgi:hypothetical protein